MKKPLSATIIHSVRKKTPLSLRQIIGPKVSYFLYALNKNIYQFRKTPHVLSVLETIDTIKKNNLSMIRFGDGEIYMIDGGDTAFQKTESDLVQKLEMIFRSTHEKLLICIPDLWGEIEKFDTIAYSFFMHHLYRHEHVWHSLLNYKKTYGNTLVTRPYLAYKDKSQCEIIFKNLFSLWNNKDVVLVEGSKSRLGVGNDLFIHVASLQRVLCPPENAYSKYKEIKSEVLKQDKSKLILISLGPAAKVLAYDLFLEGYRVLDIGHVDMEYEMFLRKQTKLTKVPFKYFNEINERTPEDCTDSSYTGQIVANIG